MCFFSIYQLINLIILYSKREELYAALLRAPAAHNLIDLLTLIVNNLQSVIMVRSKIRKGTFSSKFHSLPEIKIRYNYKIIVYEIFNIRKIFSIRNILCQYVPE